MKDVDIEDCITHTEGVCKRTHTQSFQTRSHFDELIASSPDDLTSSAQIRSYVMRWCAKQRLVVSYHQLETIEMNFPYHRAQRISEAIPLGLASVPSTTSPHPDASPCYSPVPSDDEGLAPIFRGVQSKDI